MIYGNMNWIVILGVIVALITQGLLSSTYKKYSKEKTRSNLTGAQLASQLLTNAQISGVTIGRVGGELTDHYSPQNHVLNLSTNVHDSRSIAALSVAAHECAHAFQYSEGYSLMGVHRAMVPMVNIGSNLSWPLVFVGLIASFNPLILAGIALFSLTVVFTMVTLPIEINASRRAIAVLESGEYMDSEELRGARKVLTAAAMTYVASLLMSILQLLRLLSIANRRRRD